MKYKKSERVQSESYSSVEELLNDAIEVINDKENFERSVNIIADENIIKYILEYIEESQLNFTFDIQVVDFREDKDEYLITILDVGEVYVEPVTDKNGRYHEIDGFMYVHKNIDSDVYNGRNRRNDTMIFEFEDF